MENLLNFLEVRMDSIRITNVAYSAYFLLFNQLQGHHSQHFIHKKEKKKDEEVEVEVEILKPDDKYFFTSHK